MHLLLLLLLMMMPMMVMKVTINSMQKLSVNQFVLMLVAGNSGIVF